MHLSRYIDYSREKWIKKFVPLDINITKEDIKTVRGLCSPISAKEIVQIYTPIVKIIANYYYNHLNKMDVFNQNIKQTPLLIGLAGSVAVGKSVSARAIQLIMRKFYRNITIDTIPTDSFLHNNAYLRKNNLLDKKGFPKSYNVKKLYQTLNMLKSGIEEITIPVYSHLYYDITKEKRAVTAPNILIIEGLNVLQTKVRRAKNYKYLLSDFFDFSIYLDADIKDIKRWYMKRFKMLQKVSFSNKESYFHRYSKLSQKKLEVIGERIWRNINEKNLIENILPTKERADIIVSKGKNHNVENIYIKKM